MEPVVCAFRGNLPRRLAPMGGKVGDEIEVGPWYSSTEIAGKTVCRCRRWARESRLSIGRHASQTRAIKALNELLAQPRGST